LFLCTKWSSILVAAYNSMELPIQHIGGGT
jgi:hypothetical protein